MLRNAQLGAGPQARHALVRQVMNGEQGGRALAAPVHIGRGQASRPVMGVHQVRAPVDLCEVGGDIGGRQAQAGETNMVVRPVAAVVGAIGRTFALVELRADQHIDNQTIRHVHAPDLARRERRVPTEFTDNVNRIFTVHHLRITGDQDTYIVQMRHGPWQRGGNVSQAAGFHQVGNLGGDEQHFLLVGILTGHRAQRAGTANADRLSTASSHDA
ncbi:hypothetical protein D3C76_695280 [compost metagenome]